MDRLCKYKNPMFRFENFYADELEKIKDKVEIVYNREWFDERIGRDYRDIINEQGETVSYLEFLKADTERYQNEYNAEIERILNNPYLVEELDENIIYAQYERYQLQWMIEHNCTLSELFTEMQGFINVQSGENASIRESFVDFEIYSSFDNGKWTCYDEWMSTDFHENRYNNSKN